jgi:restriction endonuclease S subunit
VRSELALDLGFVKLTNESHKPIPDWALLRAGDILVNSTGTGTLGRVGFVREQPGRLTADSHVAIVRPTTGAVPEFVALSLHARERELVELGGGSTNQQELRPDDLKKLRLVLPPVDEQRRIVTLLRQDLERVASAEAQLLTAGDELRKLRISVLALLADDAWPRRRIDEVGEVFVGSTPKRSDPSLWGGDVPWVASGEVAFSRIAGTRETITDAGLGNRSRRLHPPGTVLLAMYGEGKTRGQAAILDVEAATNQAVAAVRLDRARMRPEFLYLCLMRQYDEVRTFGRGGQQLNLNKALVQAIEVPCPPIERQGELIQEIEGYLRVCGELDEALSTAKRLGSAARVALLRDSLGGHLAPVVPRDSRGDAALSS